MDFFSRGTEGNIMRRVLAIALATAAMGLATPAAAAVTLVQQNGPDLATHIHASSTNSTNDALTVYGSTASGGASQDVTFTGNSNIHITGGAGFAAISDAPNDGTLNWTSLIIDPTSVNFTAIEFSIQLQQAGNVNVYYMLASGGGWQLSTGSPIGQAANANVQYILSGEVMTAIRIDSTVPIQEIKQNSITVATTNPVPEPGTWGLMLLGFAGVGMAVRRSRKRSTTLMQVA
jgi:hypothetical protein